MSSVLINKFTTISRRIGEADERSLLYGTNTTFASFTLTHGTPDSYIFNSQVKLSQPA